MPAGGIDDVASSPLMTVIESFHLSRGSRTNGSDPRGPSFMAQYSGAHPCGLKIPTKRGIFPAACALAEGTSAGNIESSSGSARVTPAPRRNVRRERCFFATNIIVNPHSFDSFEMVHS